MGRKILYNPGYGAGWSTWQSGVPPSFSCTYQPIIEALERGESLSEEHPAVKQYVAECQEKFNEDPYLGGLHDLKIYDAPDGVAVRVDEYDGFESVVLSGFF